MQSPSCLPCLPCLPAIYGTVRSTGSPYVCTRPTMHTNRALCLRTVPEAGQVGTHTKTERWPFTQLRIQRCSLVVQIVVGQTCIDPLPSGPIRLSLSPPSFSPPQNPTQRDGSSSLGTSRRPRSPVFFFLAMLFPLSSYRISATAPFAFAASFLAQSGTESAEKLYVSPPTPPWRTARKFYPRRE